MRCVVVFAEHHRNAQNHRRHRCLQQRLFGAPLRRERRVRRLRIGTEDAEIHDASQRRRGRRRHQRIGGALVRVEIPIPRGLFQDTDEMHRAIAVGRGFGERTPVVVVELDDADRDAARFEHLTRRRGTHRRRDLYFGRKPRDQSPTQVAVRTGDQHAHD
jgi:hypothetical protein